MSPPESGTDAKRPGIAEEDLYRIVRLAVEDAILGVLGTLLLLGVATVIALTGFQILLKAGSAAWAALGVGVMGFGVYVGAATLGIIPTVREFFASR